jgi:hypothetical protein
MITKPGCPAPGKAMVGIIPLSMIALQARAVTVSARVPTFTPGYGEPGELAPSAWY